MINYNTKNLIKERYREEHSLINELVKELPKIRPVNNIKTWGGVKKVLQAFGSNTIDNTADRIIKFVDGLPNIDENIDWSILKDHLLQYQEKIEQKL